MANKGVFPADTSLAGSAEDAVNANRTTGDNQWIGIDGVPTGSSLLDGVKFWDAISGTSYTMQARVNGSTVSLFAADSVGGGMKLVGALDCDDFPLTTVQFEPIATGSLPTQERRYWYDSTVARAGYTGASSAKFYNSRCNLDGSTVRRIPCSFNVATLGTPGTVNTDTILSRLDTFQLDAVAEQINVTADSAIPVGFSAAHNLTLELRVLLLSAETNGDDINAEGVWRTIPAGESPTKAATTFANADVDIGTDSAQFDSHIVSMPVIFNAAGNVVAAGDKFVATINLRLITEVTGVIVVGADLLVPVLNMED